MLAKRGAVEHARADTPPPRARTSYAYAVDGTSVCKTVFLYVHSATRYVLKKVQSHLEAGIVTALPHGNAGAVPWHALTCDDIQMVKIIYLQICIYPRSSTASCAKRAQWPCSNILALFNIQSPTPLSVCQSWWFRCL